jgi:hypothetical protein
MRVFVTSDTWTGNFGGLAGADADCATAAQAASLGGSWKAWLSDSTTNAIDRIQDVGPWYLVDGTTLVFHNKANLLTSPLAPITEDENGQPWQGTGLYGTWSGSTNQGASDPPMAGGEDYCVDWTSGSASDGATVGSPNEADQDWGGGGAPLPCNGTNSLYCFEQ